VKRTTRRVEQIGLFLITLLALVLRLYRLGAQSLWADEMSSLVTAVKPVGRLLYDLSNEIHPPFYHLVLKGWIAIFGISEVGIRSLSVLSGMILVLLTYAIGRRLAGEVVGLVAAFFSALSAFQVYYSQEARMYMPLAALSALSVYCFIRFLEAERRESEHRLAGYWELETGHWVQDTEDKIRGRDRGHNLYLWASLYALTTAACLYTHYSFPIILLMESLVYLLWLIVSWSRGKIIKRGARWALIQAVVILLYWPWLPIAYRQLSTWPSISRPQSLAFIAGEAFRLLSVGYSGEVRWALLSLGLVFLVGLWPGGWPAGSHRLPRSISYALTLLYSAFPVLMMYALSLWRPAYRPKFFLVGAPIFFIVLARGVIIPWRLATGNQPITFHPRHLIPGLWAVICPGLIVGVSLLSLDNYYFDKRYTRDDYRGIAHYLERHGHEGDAILLNASGQKDVFSYYYRGRLPLYPLPRGRPLDEAQTERDLENLLAEYHRVFALFWATDESDPGRFIESWLDSHAYKALDDWYGNVRLVMYAMPEEAEAAQTPLQVTLGDKALLLGYSLQKGEVEPGRILQLTLFWKALAPFKERYNVFLHVLDEENHIVGQRDVEPGGGAAITTVWQVGQVLADNYGVPIRPGTPPGLYRLEVGMYSLATGQRLAISEGENSGQDKVILESIRVLRPKSPPSLDELSIHHRQKIAYGPLTLLGYDLYKVGYEHHPDEPLHQGEALHLNLYWQTSRPPDADWGLTLRLIDEEGVLWTTRPSRPAGDGYPTTMWEAGEVVRGQHDILVPPEAPPGRYRLTGQLTSPGGEALQPLWVSNLFTVE
jgi:mannosyltransferase